MRFRIRPIRFYEADNGAQGGASGGNAQDPADGLRNLLARNNNDAMALAGQLYAENFQLREKNRTLSGQLPGEGSVVLSKDDAALFQSYRGLGELETVKKLVSEHPTLAADLAKRQRGDLIRSAAEASGFKASVLGQLMGDLAIEVREVEADGKKRPAAFVKSAEGQEIGLAQYAEQHWADFLPALGTATPQPAGTQYPPQRGGGAPPQDLATSLAGDFQKARDTAFNPLRPATTQGQGQQ